MKKNIDHPYIEELIENTGENSPSKIASSILRMFASNEAEYKKFTDKLRLNGRTLLIETHSEHLLLRLLRRVRETNVRNSKKHEWRQSSMTPLVREMPETAIQYSEDQDSQDHQLTPDDLSVVYVRPTPAGVKFTPLTVTNKGDFDAPWPEGFFEERESEWY